MANVYLQNLIVPAIARNKRDYHGGTWIGGSGGSGITIVNNPTTEANSKVAIEFIATKTPGIADYSIYLATFGLHPLLRLFILDDFLKLQPTNDLPTFSYTNGVPISLIYDLPQISTGYIILS
jgi:hypothetical protein